MGAFVGPGSVCVAGPRPADSRVICLSVCLPGAKQESVCLHAAGPWDQWWCYFPGLIGTAGFPNNLTLNIGTAGFPNN